LLEDQTAKPEIHVMKVADENSDDLEK